MEQLLTVLISTTENCNLRCKYCFRKDAGEKGTTVTLDAIERTLALASTRFKCVSLVWMGGEPMLAGLDFFRKVMQLEKQYTDRGMLIQNNFQTNGTLVNRKWVKFFRENEFTVGVSFDGEMHDRMRGKSKETLKAIEKLKKGKVNLSCLSVLYRGNNDQIAIYEYFKKMGVPVSLNPVLNEGGATENADVLLSSDEYTEQSIKLFDLWLRDRNAVDLQLFSSYVNSYLGSPRVICCNASCIGRWLALETNGDLYPCNHAELRNFPLGNVFTLSDFSQIYSSKSLENLLTLAVEKRELCKSSCEYYSYCRGNCIADIIRDGALKSTGGFACENFKKLFGHIKGVLDEIVEKRENLGLLNPFVRNAVLRYVSKVKPAL